MKAQRLRGVAFFVTSILLSTLPATGVSASTGRMYIIRPVFDRAIHNMNTARTLSYTSTQVNAAGSTTTRTVLRTQVDNTRNRGKYAATVTITQGHAARHYTLFITSIGPRIYYRNSRLDSHWHLRVGKVYQDPVLKIGVHTDERTVFDDLRGVRLNVIAWSSASIHIRAPLAAENLKGTRDIWIVTKPHPQLLRVKAHGVGTLHGQLSQFTDLETYDPLNQPLDIQAPHL